MDTGSRRVLVVPRAGGGWELRETRDGPLLARGGTKGSLVARARLRLEDARGGEVVVLAADGTVEATYAVGTGLPRPWWYVRPGASRWLLPALFALQLLLRLVAGSRTTAEVALTAFLAVALVLGALAGWGSHRSDRTRVAPADPV